VTNQFLTAFFVTTVYAVVRYAGFGNVPLIHVPVYIMNKSISMTAVEALFMAALGNMRSENETVRFWTSVCSQLVFVHILLSLGILSKGYFTSFFNGDKMSLTGEIVLLTGALAAYCFWRLQATEVKRAIRRTLTILACTLAAIHLLAMGFAGWLQVQKWNGGLPPITLLSFILVISGLIIFVWTKERRVSPYDEEGRVLRPETES
jgi:hypothetical protein